MRSTIDPAESDYYQAIIAYGIDPGTQLSLKGVSLTGATLLHSTPGSKPDTQKFSTAIVVTGNLADDDLAAVADDMISVEQQGTLVVASISSMPNHAERLYKKWQCNAPRRSGAEAEDGSDDLQPVPIFIAAESEIDRSRCIQFLNDFTYGAMTICVDWFDVRCESGLWGSPCHYHYTADLPFEEAFAAFYEGIVPGELSPVVVLENSTFDLQQIEIVANFTDGLGDEDSLSILTSIVPCSSAPTGAVIHWLHPL